MSDRDTLRDDQIILNDKVKTLEPLRGRSARLMIPELISVGSQLIVALDGKVDFSAFIGGGQISVREAALLATHFWIFFKDQLPQLEEKFVPFLLQCDAEEEEYVKNEAEPQEVYYAVFKAIKFYWKHHATPEVIEGLSFRVSKK